MYSSNSTLCIWTFRETILPKTSFGLRVLSLPAYVCLSVHLCVNHLLVYDNSRPVHARITNLGPNMWKTLPNIPIILFCGGIDLDHQGQIYFKNPNLPQCELVRSITHQPFKIGSQKFGQDVHNSAAKILIAFFFFFFFFFFGGGGVGGWGWGWLIWTLKSLI